MTLPAATRHRRPPVRRLTAVVLALGAMAASCGDDSTDAASGTTDLTSVVLTSDDGGTTTLAAYAGTPTVVNFFAAYCAPCRAEMPDLEAISSEFAGRVDVVGVSRDLDEASWKAMVDETGVTFPTTFEGAAGALFEAVDGRFMPTTIFLDAEGQLVHTVAGLQTEDSLRDLINTELLR